MTTNLIALCLVAAMSILLPLIILLIVWIKGSGQRKGIVLSFLTGGVICLIFEWLLKEQGLKWLFNHTDLQEFVNRNYLLYIFLIALVGALFAFLPEYLVVVYGYKKMSFVQASMLGLGFAMAESTTLVGYQSIASVVTMLKDSEMMVRTTSKELFLSSFERCLLLVIHVAIAVIFVYFIDNKMPVKGILLAVTCYVAAAFIPGFFIAFSTVRYLELYTRDTALLLVYIVLGIMAVSGGVILNVIRQSMKEGNY